MIVIKDLFFCFNLSGMALDVQAGTGRKSMCRCFTTDSLPRGYRDSLFGLQRMQNSTVNTRDSRFILVRALDCGRVIALRPVGVSLCVVLIVCCCVVALSRILPSFI